MKICVIAAVDDLFFASKIRGTAAQVGAEIIFVKSADALIDEVVRRDTSAVILDLQVKSLDPFTAAERLKADERTCDVPVVAFFPHVEADLQRRAKQAGIEYVMPRSVFNQRLLEILGGQL